MSDSPSFRSYAATIAVFATMLYGALIVAVFGLISLYADRDVITDPSFGPLAGPFAAAAAIAAVLALLLNLALTVPRALQRVSIFRAVIVGVAAYFAYVVLGGIGVIFGTGALFYGLIFMADEVLSPFAAMSGALALIVALLFMLVLASGVGEHGRPQWPWEKAEDEDRDDTGPDHLDP